MKRLFLAFFVVMFAVFAFAGGIKVRQGKASYIKEKNGKVAVVINWDKAKWNNEKPLKEQWGDEYKEYVKAGLANFIEGFNKESQKVKAVSSDEPSDYVMTITISNVDKFYSVMSIVPGNKHKIWGEASVRNKKTGEEVCTYVIDEFKGGRDFSIFDSFKEAMRDMGAKLASIK